MPFRNFNNAPLTTTRSENSVDKPRIDRSPKVRYLAADEEQRLRAALLELTWANVDFNTQVLTVVGDSSKAGHTRHIPLNTEASNALRKWREPNPKQDRVFSIDTSFKSAWGELLADAKIAIRFLWHDLRHHFASRLAQAGVPLNTIREVLGHGSMSMTLRYAHLAPDQKKEAVAQGYTINP